MKKIYLTTFAFLLIGIFYGQNKKGDMDIFLQTAPYVTTNDTNDFGLIAITGIEFFASNKFSISSNFYSSNNAVFKNDSGTTIRSYGILVTGQYYFLNLERWKAYGQTGFGYGIDNYSSINIDNSGLFLWTVGAGANYSLTEKLYLKLLIPYFNAKNTTRDLTAANGVTAFLGLGYKF
ncbi:MAG: hypothetical protein COS19_05875 [Flavobacteriaceae bacterium CG02_land_8_20_14_3_00_34_13]|nr:MAG: hypothetical protein COS19_05875 [Flavobacteriaceae bacterium CG02_land_8_20_14_3_00_34_13]